jgi:hypothetical protein
MSQFTLFHTTLGFLSNNQSLTKINFTDKVQDSERFDSNFDDSERKLFYYNTLLKVRKISDLPFTIKNLDEKGN